MSCGTVANIKTTELNINNQAFKNKTVYISDKYQEIYWKDSGLHSIGQKPNPGETFERAYNIDKKMVDDGNTDNSSLFVSFEKQSKTLTMLHMLKPKLEQAVAQSGGIITTNQKTANYTLSASITMGPTPAPAYASRNVAESMGKSLMTLGLAPTGYYNIKNDYKLALSISDPKGNIISSNDYIVNNFVEQSVSDLSFSKAEVNTQTAMKLFESSLNERISDFISTEHIN